MSNPAHSIMKVTLTLDCGFTQDFSIEDIAMCFQFVGHIYPGKALDLMAFITSVSGNAIAEAKEK